MPLRDETVISHIGILEDGRIQIRRSRRMYDGDQLLSETYHRSVLSPGAPLVAVDPRVRAIAQAVWTPAVVAAFEAAKLEREKRVE